uniref:Protein tyrosine phosphatase domain-containing protein 1 n=1 Tax=Iconisemion striatum TaxID=60296 RepID=A0A1A7YCK4_9TELE
MAAGVSILTDLSYYVSGSLKGEINNEMERGNTRIPTAKYTKMGETLRHVIPSHMQCSMACGGKACKYENPSRWSDEEQPIKGLYSSWITDSLLAMARPSTEVIKKYGIIQQFHRSDLKTVINLQRPGEHASCGPPLEQESGFTYLPETFMEAGIYYYNFGWKDYGVASLTTILDMVKVMSFAVQEGKMAVHCHAGLGRTGVLLACYLVFTTRMNADQAILFVRTKRPNSIQTRGQLLCVREFAQFLVPLRSVFSCAEPKTSAVTLSQYLTRQHHLLHGYEARQMKNVPKIVQLVCRLLIKIAANRQVVMEKQWLEKPDLTVEVEKTVSQQALQQLGKEMIGKGIPVLPLYFPRPPALQSPHACDQPLAIDNELDPVWRQKHSESSQRSSLFNKRSLSDSWLHNSGSWPHHGGLLKNNKLIHCPISHSLSERSLTASDTPSCYLHPWDTRDLKMGQKQDNRSFISQKQHDSLNVDWSECGRKALFNTTLPSMLLQNKLVSTRKECVDRGPDSRSATEVPYISLQSEPSPENRRLLVARALAMDLNDSQLSSKVSVWQMELNTREGAWQKLCAEQDPLVLSSLMWSWLEQLRDPLISQEDVEALSQENDYPLNALNSLEKGHKLTLLCILDCAAHLLPVPDEMVTTFLNQTIKACTRMDPASEENQLLYTLLKAILTPALYELWDKAEKMPPDQSSLGFV